MACTPGSKSCFSRPLHSAELRAHSAIIMVLICMFVVCGWLDSSGGWDKPTISNWISFDGFCTMLNVPGPETNG